jgi:hypothetical protein
MKHKIELTISSCNECPFRRYDSNYGMSYDSGYDCSELGERIVDDYELNKGRIDPFIKVFQEKCKLKQIK